MNQESFLFRWHHPALGQLLRLQTVGKLKRIFDGLKSPRKKVLAVFAVLLLLVWISQAIATVFLRDAADPQQLQQWVPMGLGIYAFWHLLKLATRPVETPFAWTPAEQEFVLAAPASRTQQISYRLLSIFNAAIAKAICFAVLMLPDIQIWYAGLIGMLLGLIFVDLLRVIFELVIFGLGRRGRNVFRGIVISAATLVFLIAIGRCYFSPTAAAELSSPGALVFFRHLFRETMDLSQSSAGWVLLTPFRLFASLTLAAEISLIWFGKLAMALGLVGSTMMIVYRIDHWMQNQTLQRESNALSRDQSDRKAVCATDSNGVSDSGSPSQIDQHVATRVAVPPRMSGAGAIMWRQFLGAFHYRQMVLFSLALPVFLSCLPLFAHHSPLMMLCHVVGGAVFYSFLLLPSALILDFRRDINRMVVLKALPIRPIYVVLGQLAAPVTLCWLFQFVVLLIAGLTGKVIWWQALIALALVLPVNVLIFSIENYIFLLSPYQRNKEGFDVFLRTILTFTGKGLLFAIGILVVIAWAILAKFTVGALSVPPGLATVIFALGVWAITLGFASFFVNRITQQFASFDPSQDVPGVG